MVPLMPDFHLLLVRNFLPLSIESMIFPLFSPHSASNRAEAFDRHPAATSPAGDEVLQTGCTNPVQCSGNVPSEIQWKSFGPHTKTVFLFRHVFRRVFRRVFRCGLHCVALLPNS